VAFGVLAVMLGLVMWLRRHGVAQFRAALPSRKSRRLELLERLTLTPQHSLHVVRINGRTLLIGVSPSGCALLEAGEVSPRPSTGGETA
jgi:flagellar biogenesis protein FliO